MPTRVNVRSPTNARKRPAVIVCFIIVPLNNAWFSVTYISNEDSSHLGLQFSVLYMHSCVEDFLGNTLDNYNNKLVVCAKNEFSYKQLYSNGSELSQRMMY